MFKGLRWQILALVMAGVVFSMSFAVRLTTTPDPTPPPPATQTPSTQVAQATDQPSDAPSATQPVATPIPLPTQPPVSDQSVLALVSQDEIPTFVEGVVGQMQRLNPLFAHLNPVDRDITRLIFNGLTRINEYGEPVPDLAESWVISRDGIEYVLRLRDNVLWQDGTPFTAEDVLFTIALLADDDFTIDPELSGFWRTIEVQKIADNLLRFRLAQPLSSFLTKLTIGILPEHILRGTHVTDLAQHPFNLSPVGTGAYQLEAFRTLDGERVNIVDLRLSATYPQWATDHNHSIARLRFHLFDTFPQAVDALSQGIIHGLATQELIQRGDMLAVRNTQIYTTVSQRVGMLIFNWDEGEDRRFFTEQRVRVALQMGLNTRVPVESRLANRAIAADSPIAIGSWAYSPDLNLPNTDSGTARQMLQTANIVWERVAEIADDDDDNQEASAPFALSDIAFTILTPDLPALVSLAEEIAIQWSILGINVTVESVDTSTHERRLTSGEFDVAIVELPLGSDPDIYRYWHAGQYPDGLNYGAVIDDGLSELLERARRDANGINRIALYRQIQRRFIDRAIAIPLYYPLFTYVVHQNVNGVQLGFIGNKSDRFRTLHDWRFVTP